MNETHGRAIVFLLAFILCVMLFGTSAALTASGWLVGTGAALAAVYFPVMGLVRGLNGFLGTIRDEIVEAREEQRPWRLWLRIPVIPPDLTGLWAVAGTVRYWWIPS
jgi:hypothetical protein